MQLTKWLTMTIAQDDSKDHSPPTSLSMMGFLQSLLMTEMQKYKLGRAQWNGPWVMRYVSYNKGNQILSPIEDKQVPLLKHNVILFTSILSVCCNMSGTCDVSDL